MDYKQQGQSLDDFGRWHSSPYQDFGNFNFGVTGAAAGIPSQVLLRGAGWAQQQAKTSNPAFGHWYDSNPPYGDDPADQAMIKAGPKRGKRRLRVWNQGRPKLDKPFTLAGQQSLFSD